MTPTDIILKAKELIEQDGWIQGAYRSRPDIIGVFHKGRCVTGALRDASITTNSAISLSGYAAYAKVYNSYATAHERLATLVSTGLITWNDAPGRTKAEVLELLEKAAQ